jgi:protein-L-isoaspartate(D-aspartate) O-methyltransferase
MKQRIEETGSRCIWWLPLRASLPRLIVATTHHADEPMLTLLLSLTLLAAPPTDTTYQEERARMVDEQIAARGVTDPAVLEAMRTVRRHRFVPKAPPELAYTDQPLPIGHGQTISQPFIVATMTQLVQPDPGDRALEVGTGSGYQAAVLAEIVDSVYTIEIVPELARMATDRLARMGYDNVRVHTGDGYRGWPEHAPFDIIIVTAAPNRIPAPLLDQLAEGGRMVIPVGPEGETQQLTLVTKTDGEITRERITPVRFVPFRRNR